MEVLPSCESSLKSAVVKPNKNILKATTEILLVTSVRRVAVISLWLRSDKKDCQESDKTDYEIINDVNCFVRAL